MVSLSPFRNVDMYVTVPGEHWYFVRYYGWSFDAGNRPYDSKVNEDDPDSPWIFYSGNNPEWSVSLLKSIDPITSERHVVTLVSKAAGLPTRFKGIAEIINLNDMFEWAKELPLPLHYEWMKYEGLYPQQVFKPEGGIHFEDLPTVKIMIGNTMAAKTAWFQNYDPINGFGPYLDIPTDWDGSPNSINYKIIEDYLHERDVSAQYRHLTTKPRIYDVVRVNSITELYNEYEFHPINRIIHAITY